MHSDLVQVGWSEEHWNRIFSAVTEEAQKARVAAQFLSVVGPLDPTTIAVPTYALSDSGNPLGGLGTVSDRRLTVNSDPTLYLTKIAVNVYLRSREAADPELNAALTMFRRAANYIARIEDALIFNGRPGEDAVPPFGLQGIPDVHHISGGGVVQGLMFGPPGTRRQIPVTAMAGDAVINAVVDSISALDAAGQLGPYACVLAPNLFAEVCRPNANFVLPRDRILPFLQGPLLRSSAIQDSYGVVVALSANPIELVVASDIHVKYLQTTEQPRLVFQVSQRIAVRIKESAAIAILSA